MHYLTNMIKSNLLLLGNEAVALAAIDSGISGVYAYPGTPSTEATEFIQKYASESAHSRWCTNEKTAMEAALGVSYVGKRALVCMKHVGLNVCADAFINASMTGVNGGLVVLVADDPSMHSSQNEQDSRFYGKFSFAPIFEPSTQQEAYNMTRAAFELSEEVGLPVLLRVVTRLAHSRAQIVPQPAQKPADIHFPANPGNWILLPVVARRRNNEVIAQQPMIEQKAIDSPFNIYDCSVPSKRGIIACGIAWNYLMEAIGGKICGPVLKLSQYPLPKALIADMASKVDEILVIEDGQPFVEDQVKGVIPGKVVVKGRLSGDLPRTGELTPDNVKAAITGVAEPVLEKSEYVVPRPPALCQGCGHRDVYNSLKDIIAQYPDGKVFSDIGCYTLGALPPFKAINSTVDMGASITMAKGAADAGLFPSVAVIGDSTFTHSGMTGLLDAVNSNSSITVIISDNLTTAMTGGQNSAGTNKFEQICIGIGVDPAHVKVVTPVPANREQIDQILKEEIEYRGVSVIIPRRECMQTLARKKRKKL